MSDDHVLAVLTEIRNWIRVASYGSVKTLLESALPDTKSRAAYQMMDGTASFEQVRLACKVSPNAVVSLAHRCVALGIMEVNEEKKRRRLFNLNDFGLINENERSSK